MFSKHHHPTKEEQLLFQHLTEFDYPNINTENSLAELRIWWIKIIKNN